MQSVKEEIPTQAHIPKALRDLQCSLTLPQSPRRSPRKRGIQIHEDTTPALKKRLRSRTSTWQEDVKQEKSLISKPKLNMQVVNDLTLLPESPVRKAKVELQDATMDKKTMLMTPPTTPDKDDRKIFIKEDALKGKKLQLMEIPPSPPRTVMEDPILEDNKENVNPYTQSIYTKAKTLFQRSFKYQPDTHMLPAREAEANALKNFVVETITSGKTQSLYVSGPPGTGKTAQIKLTLSEMFDLDEVYTHPVQCVEIDSKDYKVGYVYINCMTINKTSMIFHEILKSLNPKIGNATSLKDSKDVLLQVLKGQTSGDMNIVVLDELDKLITTNQQILFELFSWCCFPESKLCLIGISNSLDMIDRLLPRLKINGMNPHTLNFLPYGAEQIEKIIVEKLQLLTPGVNQGTPLFHPAALKLCSKKCASNSGDLRRAFDIIKNSFELLELELKAKDTPMEDYKMETAPTVKINHIAKVFSRVNVTAASQISSNSSNLTIQQKFILALLVRAESVLTLNDLYNQYTTTLDNPDFKLLGMLKKHEFLEVLTTLESINLVKVQNTIVKRVSVVKVSAVVGLRDLEGLIGGIPILQRLFRSVA